VYGSYESHYSGHRGSHGCSCGHRFHRRFLNPKEKAARLKEYLADLKAEVVEVEKRINELEQEARTS